MKAIFKDAFNLLCGELLGAGIHRKVYACKLRPELVVKVECQLNNRCFANVFEMEFWNDQMHNETIAKWLAPCEFLSPDGRILLQRRAQPVQRHELPGRVPSFLSDLKPANFGILDGRLVCVDYAMTVSNPSSRMRKINWHYPVS